MLRSMYAGVSGLNSHQQMMDTTGNNISNVNTIGFKSSRVTFQEMLSQTIQGATAPEDNRAGTNPQQIGLGVGVGSIDNDMSSGNLQSTGKNSDVAIEGDGFFVLRDGESQSYSRAGNFNFDEEGRLYSSSTGKLVQGWKADENGEFDDLNAQNIDDISLRQEINAVATDEVRYGKNLDASVTNELEILNQTLGDDISMSLQPAEGEFNSWNFNINDSNGDDNTGNIVLNTDGTIDKIKMVDGDDETNIDEDDSFKLKDNTEINVPAEYNDFDFEEDDLFVNADDSSQVVNVDYSQDAKRDIAVDVFDNQGEKHTVEMPLKKSANNKWEIDGSEIEIDGVSDIELEGDSHEIVFDSSGNVETGELTSLSFTPNGTGEEQTVDLDFSEVTQFAGDMTANFSNVNGYEDGALESFSFTETGEVVGSYSNGLTQTQAKLGMANFSNPAGLTRKEGVFEASSNSGDPELGPAAQGGRGALAPATLEMSNANLSQEFTNMITAQ
ncbi:MAG: flagellar hook protein FlgE, partial [Halanaerobium sp.]